MDDGRIKSVLEELGKAKTIRFSRLLTLCSGIFGEPRIAGSHHIFKAQWQGDPRINLQTTKDEKAKRYQVEQVIKALERLLEE